MRPRRGWRGGEGSWRGHLLSRVRCRAPWVRDGVVMGMVGVGLCGRGCKTVLLGRGLCGLGWWLAGLSAAEGAALCSLGV